MTSNQNDTDFDEAAWLSRLEKAHTNDDFMSLLGELPSAEPMTDDQAVERFQVEMAEQKGHREASGWPAENTEEDLRKWCRFWFMAEWSLPDDQQKRCAERVLGLAGFGQALPAESDPASD